MIKTITKHITTTPIGAPISFTSKVFLLVVVTAGVLVTMLVLIGSELLAIKLTKVNRK